MRKLISVLILSMFMLGAGSKPKVDPCAQYGSPWVPNLKYKVEINQYSSPTQVSYPYGAYIYVKDANGNLIPNPTGKVTTTDYTNWYCVNADGTSIKLGTPGGGCHDPSKPVYDPPAYKTCKGL